MFDSTSTGNLLIYGEVLWGEIKRGFYTLGYKQKIMKSMKRQK